MKLDFATFSTEGILCEDERLESYRENMQGVFLTELDKDARSSLQAKMNTYFLDEILLVDCSTIGQIFYRNERKIADDNIDHFFVQLFLKGGTEGVDSQAGLGGNRDTIFFIDSSKPWRAYNPSFHTISLIVPRGALLSRIGGLEYLHGYSLTIANNPYAKLFKSFVMGLYRDITVFEKDLAPVLSKNCVDLLAGALRFRDKNTFGSTCNEGLLGLKIKEHVQKNLRDPHLSVDSLTKEFALSRSSLYRIFPEKIGGVSGFIKSRRLNMAYRELASGASGKSISEVAYRSGFKNSSSFTRAFKERFKATPMEVLKGARPNSEPSSKAEHLKWHDWLEILS